MSCGFFCVNEIALLDANLYRVIGYMLRYAKTGASKTKVRDRLEALILRDPLAKGMDARTYYEYRVRHFLRCAATGFSASRHWDGYSRADGGMLFLEKSGEVTCLWAGRR